MLIEKLDISKPQHLRDEPQWPLFGNTGKMKSLSKRSTAIELLSDLQGGLLIKDIAAQQLVNHGCNHIG